MRAIFLLPLTALVAGAAGCGSEGTEPAVRSVPQRDLTLVTQTSEAKVASKVETQQLQIQHRTVRRSQPAQRAAVPRSHRVEPRVVLATVAAPRAAIAAPEPVAQPEASSPANDRELLPGKTVTLIPATSGPSPGSDRADEIPAARGRPMVVTGGGGRCRGRGRGPGIGIATAPRPDLR